MSTMSVTLGVSLAKNGIFTASLTHLQMSRTNSGFYQTIESESELMNSDQVVAI